MRPVEDAPHFQAAMAYMGDKGYPDLDPLRVDKVDGLDCWYFQFGLPEGVLELEVEYRDAGWHWKATSFVYWEQAG